MIPHIITMANRAMRERNRRGVTPKYLIVSRDVYSRLQYEARIGDSRMVGMDHKLMSCTLICDPDLPDQTIKCLGSPEEEYTLVSYINTSRYPGVGFGDTPYGIFRP
mgnify:CR=1 FL=1